jgi:hypothetical protein
MDIRRKYTRPDREGAPNIARWNAVQQRWERLMRRRGLAGRWRLLCQDIRDFCFRRSVVYRWLCLRQEALRVQRKYSLLWRR